MENITENMLKVNEAFKTAATNQDAAAISEVYTEDAQFLPPNGEKVSGRANIKAAFQGIFDSGIDGATLEDVEKECYDDTAWEKGTYTLYADGQVVDKGKYTVVLKNVTGEWKYYRDIFNSDNTVSTHK